MKTMFWFFLACIAAGIFLISPWGTALLKLGGLKVLPPVAAAPAGDYLDGALLITKCKRVVRSVVRDPSSVKWNDEAVWSNKGVANASLDFTALNGLGGPVRETWYFTFDAGGKIISILTPQGEQLKPARKEPQPIEPDTEKEAMKAAAISAQAAMEGRSLVEIEGTHGKALRKDAGTGWAEWPKFSARFAGGKVVEVKLH